MKMNNGLEPIKFLNIRNMINKFIPNIFKPRIKGTWSEIVKEVSKFSSDPQMISSNGFLIKFVGVKKFYTPYIFNIINKGKLKLRKYNKCFYIPGDSGQINISDEWNLLFELIEIPSDTSWKININDIKKKYRIKQSPKLQHQYY